jgi:hypothetical protein
VVEQEARAGVGPAADDEQRHARRQAARDPTRQRVIARDIGALENLVEAAHVQRGGDVERGVLVVWTGHATTSRNSGLVNIRTRSTWRA